ncbi:hypothetical protein PENARI_c020G11699 [Penicillium arizonense]|uniref:C2 domain-containing protein n=1 Tax=Penicillium arizonense TaxID=1835702 RepID=A0A1F5L9A9_PENAI|nr:hypothetical protein PENARI_c020G11699 [Penicillium arizonense]OGE49636.1 hypothetical protein PENARI_c020G11699 [Penicillium arizonense]
MSTKLTHTKVNHAAGIFADISVDGPIIGTLVAIIDRAKNLPNRKTMGKQNPYCAARLGKEAKKTQTDLRGGQTPRWDSELRFTVHESPDYFKLKVSVFNDDKKTDMIGETWIDLHNLIIPGGSQNDHWHPLQCRGKYAGDIRIEMTYYDTREQDEAVLERRQEAADRVQGKIPSAPSSTGVSGPRQLKDVKRRPLPSGPPGAPAPARPAPLEQAHSAPPPLQHPVPSRPAIPEHANSMPVPPEPLAYAPRLAEPAYEEPMYRAPSPVPQSLPPSRGGYDGADTYTQEWEEQAVAPLSRRTTHEIPYHAQESLEDTYDSRPQQPRSQSDYDQPPSRDYGLARQGPVYEADSRGRMYNHGHQDHYVEDPRYNPDPAAYGPVTHAYELPAQDFPRSASFSGPVDDPRYHPHSVRPLQITGRPEHHPEYATMQPRVEDEDEDGMMPPPPPLHRSRESHSQLRAPRTSPQSYVPYIPKQTPSRPPATNLPSSMSTPSHLMGHSPAVPASLVAGYEPEDASERAAFERSTRRRSSHWDDEMMLSEVPAPVPVSAPVLYEAPIHPLQTSPRPIAERPSSSRGGSGSVSPDMRAVTRKSVSPRPSSSDGRGSSSIPFSPDSYSTLNPHTSRPPSRDPSPGYDSPSHSRDSLVRAHSEPPRDVDQPIIGDDGREIDPSDHLPTDTWAPEPERKNRKPEVIIRFKHSPRPTSRGNESTTSRAPGPPRVGFKTETTYDRSPKKYTPAHVHASPGSMVRTPPRMDYAHGRSDSYTDSRGYSTPTSTERPRSSRGSVSPSPSARSPLYDYNTGPPIPSKVPITHGSPSYPVMSGNPNGNVRMDALSRELSTIDIGSAGCSPGRGAIRKYVPRSSASMGYAS